MYTGVENEASDQDYDSIQENTVKVTSQKSPSDFTDPILKTPVGFAIHYCITCFGSPPVQNNTHD